MNSQIDPTSKCLLLTNFMIIKESYLISLRMKTVFVCMYYKRGVKSSFRPFGCSIAANLLCSKF